LFVICTGNGRLTSLRLIALEEEDDLYYVSVKLVISYITHHPNQALRHHDGRTPPPMDAKSDAVLKKQGP
jgi:hypothetical protein